MIPPHLLIPTKVPATPAEDVQRCARWCEAEAVDKPRCIQQCYLRYLHSRLDAMNRPELTRPELTRPE
jgi:hypothetical protein